jgi:hypothetical protein
VEKILAQVRAIGRFLLQAAVGETAGADVLAYAAPTYYGMLVAEVQTAA